MRRYAVILLMLSALAGCGDKSGIHQLRRDAADDDGAGATNTVAADAPAKPEKAKAAEGISNADLLAARRKVEKSLDKTFVVEAHTPFIVASNQTPSAYKRSLDSTIMGAYKAFYRDFFDEKPDKIITIYLFRENLTYRKWANRLFGDTEVSHFGYYKPGKRALVMNIGTGGGTLVHEMVHAFMHFDFPDCPAWFSEGMGSLFEACQYGGGRIRGVMNWRYPILKRGLDNQRYKPIPKLIATNTREFYKDTFGMHYSEARYFCMYLQEKRWLRKFYKSFRDNYADDHTGRKQLEKVTGRKLEVLEKEWLVWAHKQKYTGR